MIDRIIDLLEFIYSKINSNGFIGLRLLIFKLQNLKIQLNGYHGFGIEMEDRLNSKTIYNMP